MLLVLSLMRNEHPRILLQLASCVRGQDHPAQRVNSKGNGLAHFVYVHLLSEADADSQAAARGLLPPVGDL